MRLEEEEEALEKTTEIDHTAYLIWYVLVQCNERYQYVHEKGGAKYFPENFIQCYFNDYNCWRIE